MQERITDELREAINGHDATFSEPALKPVEIAIFLCLTHPEQWVLVERVPYNPRVQASPMYIALRRRGFKVSYRSDRGVKNVWAQWPHALPHLDIAEFHGELDTGYMGAAEPEPALVAV